MYRDSSFETTIRKQELIDKIRSNMQEHQEIFEEALEGYKKALVGILEKKYAAAKEGKCVSHHINLVMPVSKLKDYERVLAMLEMSTEEEIVINETQFAQYVRDEWDWKEQFLVANSTYSPKAMEFMDDGEGV